ncbi:hypothetical protein HDU93_000499 [Gonapodya sp. JEL0774]|nr:hypothetical protein HDU93_000499 [Gonapodya sp. JEL0774]
MPSLETLSSLAGSLAPTNPPPIPPLKIHERILSPDEPLEPLRRVRYVPVGQSDSIHGARGDGKAVRSGPTDLPNKAFATVNGRPGSITTEGTTEDRRGGKNEMKNGTFERLKDRNGSAGQEEKLGRSGKAEKPSNTSSKNLKRENATHTTFDSRIDSKASKEKSDARDSTRETDTRPPTKAIGSVNPTSNGRKRSAPTDSSSSESSDNAKAASETLHTNKLSSKSLTNGSVVEKPPPADPSRSTDGAAAITKKLKVERVDSPVLLSYHGGPEALSGRSTSPAPSLSHRQKLPSEDRLSTMTNSLRDFDAISLDSAQSAAQRKKHRDGVRRKDSEVFKKDHRHMAEKAMKPCVDIATVVEESHSIYEICEYYKQTKYASIKWLLCILAPSVGQPPRSRRESERLEFESVMLEYPGMDAVER